MINNLLTKLEENHPGIYAILMLIIFFLGCTFFWGLGMLAKYIISIW